MSIVTKSAYFFFLNRKWKKGSPILPREVFNSITGKIYYLFLPALEPKTCKCRFYGVYKTHVGQGFNNFILVYQFVWSSPPYSSYLGICDQVPFIHSIFPCSPPACNFTIFAICNFIIGFMSKARTVNILDLQKTTFISSTCVRILYSVSSVAKLWIGQADKSHCHFKNFTVTLIFMLLLTWWPRDSGGGGVRMNIAKGVDKN